MCFARRQNGGGRCVQQTQELEQRMTEWEAASAGPSVFPPHPRQSLTALTDRPLCNYSVTNGNGQTTTEQIQDWQLLTIKTEWLFDTYIYVYLYCVCVCVCVWANRSPPGSIAQNCVTIPHQTLCNMYENKYCIKVQICHDMITQSLPWSGTNIVLFSKSIQTTSWTSVKSGAAAFCNKVAFNLPLLLSALGITWAV